MKCNRTHPRAPRLPKRKVRLLHQLIALHPSLMEYRIRLIGLYYGFRCYEEATEEAEEFLRLTPGEYYAHSYLALIWSARGADERALEEYEKVLQIKPEHDFTFEYMGDIYLQQGRIEDARNSWLRSLQIRQRQSHGEASLYIDRLRCKLAAL